MLKKLLFLLFLVCCYTPQAFAQEEPENTSEETTVQEEEEENPDPVTLSRGVLASVGKVSKKAGISTSMDISLDEDASPNVITGSIQASRGSCNVSIKNNSTQSAYSLRLKVESFGEDGRKNGSRYMSMRLGPGESESKSVTCREAAGYQLFLSSGSRR